MLKSKVVNSYIVAHQSFVARLLGWIPTLFERSSGFRALFAEIVLRDSADTNVSLKKDCEKRKLSICEAVMLNDVSSWKEVRSLWLSLLIDGLMKDYDSKKELATRFTQNYPGILSDFISDDQVENFGPFCGEKIPRFTKTIS